MRYQIFYPPDAESGTRVLLDTRTGEEISLEVIANRLNNGGDTEALNAKAMEIARDLIGSAGNAVGKSMSERIAHLEETVAAQQVQIDGFQKILMGQGEQVQPPAPAQETGDEVYNPDMLKLILNNGIPNLIEQMAAACEQEHNKRYAPEPSVFQAWAEVLRAYWPQMREAALKRFDQLEKVDSTTPRRD